MGFIPTTYCQVSEVDAYAERNGLTEWTCLDDDEKLSMVEWANRMIHAWHSQKMLWKAGEFNFPCTLQAIYIAKNKDALNLAEIASNASSGSFNDSINSVEAGATPMFDTWAFTLMKQVMAKNQVESQPRFARG